jgi:hypothetical protein
MVILTGGTMAKIINDKYYTPPDLVKYIVEKTKEIIGEQNITEYGDKFE